MNATPEHLDDETLSALLDGAGGGSVSGTAGHLATCGRCAGRKAELAAARDALAAGPPEPLDELTRRRLVAGALQAAGATPARPSRSRWASRPLLAGSAAAVLLAVLAGVPFVLGDNGAGRDATLSAQAPAARDEAGTSFLGDLGDLGDRDHLRLRLAGAGDTTLGYAPAEPGPAEAQAGSRSAAPPAAPSVADAAGTSAEKATAQPAADTFANDLTTGDRGAADSCVTALLNGPARGGRVLASGTGTFEGRPAVVAAFELGGGTVAFVANRSGCGVLDRFSF